MAANHQAIAAGGKAPHATGRAVTINAVSTQVWIALATFVLVAIAKKTFKLEGSLYSILRILSVTLFEKEPINQVLTAREDLISNPHDEKQLILFDF